MAYESVENDAADLAGSGDFVTEEYADAFTKVRSSKRVVWRDCAVAFEAALCCWNTQASRDFCVEEIPKVIPIFCGDGDPPSTPPGQPPADTGSAWDDWCGQHRRKGLHPAEDQTKYFQTALRSAVKLVLIALEWDVREAAIAGSDGSAPGQESSRSRPPGICEVERYLIGALDMIFYPRSPIYNYRREIPEHQASYDVVDDLYNECVRLWIDGRGPEKQLAVMERAAIWVENADSKKLSEAGKHCIAMIDHLAYDKRSGISRNHQVTHKALKKRLKESLRRVAIEATKSLRWQQRRDALDFLEFSIRKDKEYKHWLRSGSKGKLVCQWVDDGHVIEELFGPRALDTIVVETSWLLANINFSRARLSLIMDAALNHIGSVGKVVHLAISELIKDLDEGSCMSVLERIMELLTVSATLPSLTSSSRLDPCDDKGCKPLGLKSSASCVVWPQASRSNEYQAAFELVVALFDTSKLHDLSATVNVMMKGKRVATRALDALVTALLTPFCEERSTFQRLVQESLFHALQSWWGQPESRDDQGRNRGYKVYVAVQCCSIIQVNTKYCNHSQAQARAVKGAWAILAEVLRLFPRAHYARSGQITRGDFIAELQSGFGLVKACLTNIEVLSAGLGDRKLLDRDEILETDLWARLLQLRYILENCNRVYLDREQVDILWRALGGATETCMRWMKLAADAGFIFKDEDGTDIETYILTEYICKIDPSCLTVLGFSCFQSFFADVNVRQGALVVEGRDGVISGNHLTGAALVGRRIRALWKDEKMHSGTVTKYIPKSDSAHPQTPAAARSPTSAPPSVHPSIVFLQGGAVEVAFLSIFPDRDEPHPLDASLEREVCPPRHVVLWDDLRKGFTHDLTELQDWHLIDDSSGPCGEASAARLAGSKPYAAIKEVVKDTYPTGMPFLYSAWLDSKEASVVAAAQDMVQDVGCFISAMPSRSAIWASTLGAW